MGDGLMHTLAFYFLAGITLAAATGVVFKRNLVHSAFLLSVTFLGVAGLYMTLEAEFLAAVQALVYSGAVAVLVVIGVMLTHRDDMSKSNPPNKMVVAGAGAALAIVGVLVWAVVATPWKTGRGAVVSVADIGRRFLTDFAPPFEAVALLLLAAVIGAVVLFKGGKVQS
ncbi:MAG TPA: NADH-quinone oxidoreductase subunit J [Negativicutes bacterium]|nr:NADH-quinone oxidoreductase subunit J [Negativicutes bacterium]